MFPITDAARTDDIRMRRRRAVALLAGIVVGGAWLLSGSGGTAPRETAPTPTAAGRTDPGQSDTDASPAWHSATGAALMVNLPCGGSITVMPKAGLSGRVLVSTPEEAPQEEAPDNAVRLTSGDTIALSGDCDGGAPDVTVQAPASMPLTIVQTGGTDLRLGAFAGPVTIIQSGGGDMVVGGAGALKVTMTGGGDLSADHLHGDLNLRQIGGGDVRITDIQAADVELSTTGSGDVAIVSGNIGRLRAALRGTGDLSVGAVVDDAVVQAGAGSDISLPHVTGRLIRDGGRLKALSIPHSHA